ncbi:hypothetical protein WOLCODRAFT_49962, partial [Wolfiporia cocos MD-104 SS10]
VYAKLLIEKGYGHPLWTPEPIDQPEVELGDIGWISKGRFYRLFNPTHPPDDPIN